MTTSLAGKFKSVEVTFLRAIQWVISKPRLESGARNVSSVSGFYLARVLDHSFWIKRPSGGGDSCLPSGSQPLHFERSSEDQEKKTRVMQKVSLKRDNEKFKSRH